MKSTDFNAKDAIKEIKEMTSAEEVQAFIEGEERKSVLDAAEKVEEPAPEKKVEYNMNPKLADPGVILEMYDDLIDELAKVEAAQRLKKKPYRLYFTHRKKLEVMRMSFLKSMR
jgi:hypothetical protein